MSNENPMASKDNSALRGRFRNTIDIIIDRLVAMFSLRPIVGNLIAIGLIGFALYYIRHEIDLIGFKQYSKYFGIGLEIAAAVQIIRSGMRSLALPVASLIIGGAIAHTMNAPVFGFNKVFFEQLMIVGVIGCAVSALSIS